MTAKKVEQNDVRMKKYYEMVQEFELKFRTAQESVQEEKHDILVMSPKLVYIIYIQPIDTEKL